MRALAAVDGNLIQGVLAVFAGGGLLGSIVALLKLRPDANTAAVTQSQGAIEVMARLNDELEKERDEWRARALECESELAKIRVDLEHVKSRAEAAERKIRELRHRHD